MRSALISKKFITAVAVLVSGLLAFSGLSPAAATGVTPAANTNSSEVTSNWTVGSGSTVTLANATGLSWSSHYRISTTSWQGKRLSLTGGITPAITSASPYLYASLTYYNANGTSTSGYSSGNLSTSGSDYQALVPADTASIEIFVNANFSRTTQYGTYSPVLGTAYTPTFAIKLDGVTQTPNNTWSGSASTAQDEIVLLGQPQFFQTNMAGTFSGNSTYTSSNQKAFACVDLTSLAADDVIKIKPVVDGTDRFGDGTYNNYFSFSAKNLESPNSSYTSAAQTTSISSAQKTIGGQVIYTAYYSRNSNLSTGDKSFAISVQNASGTELNVNCALAPISQSVVPTLVVQGSNLAVSVTDSSFSGTTWKWVAYKASDNTELGSGTATGNMGTNSLSSCGQNGCTSVAPAGVAVYVKVAKTYYYLDSGFSTLSVATPLSASSATATLPNPWVTISPAVSGGTAPGDATLVSSNIDYSAAAQDPTLNLPTSLNASDGNNGILKAIQSVDFTVQPPVFSFKLFRIGASGIDSTFAAAGAGGVSLGEVEANSSAFSGWYGARNKWTSVLRIPNLTNPSVIQYKVIRGSFNSASSSTPIVKTAAQLSEHCSSLMAGSTANSLNPVSMPTAEPLYSLSCRTAAAVNGVFGYKVVYVKIADNGTLTTVLELNNGDVTTDTGWFTVTAVSNVSAAAASDVAYTIVGYTYKFQSPSQTDVVTRKGFQIKVDGSVTEISNPYTSTATTQTTEKSYIFSKTSTGVATTGFLRTVAAGVTSYKWANLSASGIITEGEDVALDAVPAFNTVVNGATVDGSVLSLLMVKKLASAEKSSCAVRWVP